MTHETSKVGTLAHTLGTLRPVAVLATLAFAGCYDGLADEDDSYEDIELEPSAPTSQVSCEPTMHVFPVLGAHNIGYDGKSCGGGSGCAVSCPDQNANSDYSVSQDHHGNDVFAHKDAELIAVTDGTIVAVGTPSNTSGLRVRLRDACGWEYYYGHMSSASVVQGQQVVAGQQVGTMGSTGAASVHLHFNVSRDGSYKDDIDPVDLLRWTSATACGAEPVPPDDGGNQPPAEPGCGGMAANDALFVDQVLSSCDGRFALVLQGDGNLVIYDTAGAAVWNTETVGKPSNALVMQDDGNLVIYDDLGNAVWNTGTHGHPGASLQMQSDGNLVIYWNGQALWNSRGV